MDEINYSELFGVEVDEKDPETVEPGADEQEKGENEQEVAEPAKIADASAEAPLPRQSPDAISRGDQSPLENTPALRGGREESDTPEGDSKQSPEENARFAAARRKAEAERDAAIAEAKRKAKEETERFIAGVFAESGLTNPYTGKSITTMEEYKEYRAQHEKEQHENLMRQTGMSEEEYRRFVETLPEVREAKAAREEAERIQREAAEQEAKTKIAEQLKEIGQLDPSVKSLDDLVQMDNYQEFFERVRRGMTMAEAFKLTNYERLTQTAAQASRQAAINAAASKQHMTPTQPRGEGTVSVPTDVRELYKAINPDATDAEIQAHWRRSQK